MNLKEKQEYYRYGPQGQWKIKDQPTLDPEITRELKVTGLERKYRFVFEGVGIIRTEAFDLNPVIVGDPRACHYVLANIGWKDGPEGMQVPNIVPWLEPKKQFVCARQRDHQFYLDDEDHPVKVSRPEFAPPGKIVQQKDRFVSLGRLLWRIEQLFSGEMLVEAGVYKHTDIVPPWEWRSIETIKTPNGLYADPSFFHVNRLKEMDDEDRNAHLSDVVRRNVAQRIRLQEEREAEEERQARAEWNDYAERERQRQIRQVRYAFATQRRRVA